MAEYRPAIGIDLGTTNCRVGIWLHEENRFDLISSEPSYVSFTETERLIGDAAKEQVCRNPASTVFDAKRLIGRKFSDLGTDVDKMHIQWPFKVTRGKDNRPVVHVEYKGREKAFSATDICSMLLGKLKDLAEVHLGSVVDTACVSVPHCYTSVQRMATRSACSLAGFEYVTLVNEPVCVALAHTLQSIGPSLGERKVVIFDLGGGSLDVSLLSVVEGVIEVKATSGDSHLGGEDFDLRLLHHFITEIKEKYERDITTHPRVVRRLMKQVERVKLTLSSEPEASLQIESLLEDFTFYSTITRACFEQMNADLFARIMACVQDCLERAGLERKDVDDVMLTGGSSRIPKVVELLTAFFDGSKLNTGINFDEAVVRGAAAIARGCCVYQVVDVVPMSLGLETADGGVHVMYHRYTPIVCGSFIREQTFTTVHDDQVGVAIWVYEGEHPQACDNVLVATVVLSGLAPAPSGVPQILVWFDVDGGGILTVHAKDKITGEKVEVCMDQEVEIDEDEERRRGLAVQVYHHDPSERPTSYASESSPREASTVDGTGIIFTSHPGVSDVQSFEGVKTTSQEIPLPSPASESICKAAEAKSQNISAPPPLSPPHDGMSEAPQTFAPPPALEGDESRPQEMSAPPPALESIKAALETASSQENPASISPPSPALRSIKSMESRSQPEFLESSSAFDFRSLDFSETSSVFKSNKSLDFLEPNNTMEKHSLEFLEPSDNAEANSGELPAPPPLHEPTIVQEFPMGPHSTQDIVELSTNIVRILERFRLHKTVSRILAMRPEMLFPLFVNVRNLERSLSEVTATCFRYLTLQALLTAHDFLLLCDKGSELFQMLQHRKVPEMFVLLNRALVQALDKLPGSIKLQAEVNREHNRLRILKAPEDGVDAQLNIADIVLLLGGTNERSPDQLRSLSESFKLNRVDALKRELDALEWMRKKKPLRFVIPEALDEILGILGALRNLFQEDDRPDRLDHLKLEPFLNLQMRPAFKLEPVQIENLRRCTISREEMLLSTVNNLLGFKNLQVPPTLPAATVFTPSVIEKKSRLSHFNSSLDRFIGKITRPRNNRLEEFSAQPSDSSSNRPQEHSQNEKISAPESSAAPSHEGKSPEFYSRSPYGRSSQVDSDERIKPQEYSAPPPPPLASMSQEFPCSSSNSINGSQVKSFRSSEFSQQLPTHTPERSQEFPEYSSKPEFWNSQLSASSSQLGSDSIDIDNVVKYTWGQVLSMTNNLSKFIGKGGFGVVYLGKLDNEKEVAVKIRDANSQQGLPEFLNEVKLLKRVNHVYLVRLLGYCLEKKQVLIYEFAEEGSIWDHLQVGGKFLDWKTRLKVALESACGLEYLHTGCHPSIIHRDIKSQNILLTKRMVAKVADFGLSKLGADQDNVSETHVTTMVKGTLGYLDPEYLKTGQLTEKSDVYSFGVVLLEIITGRKPIQNADRKSFIGDWVEDHYSSNNSTSRLKYITDPVLGGHYNSKAMKLVVNIAKGCLHPHRMDRPEMSEVVHVLKKAQLIEHEKKPSKWLPFM